MQHQYHIIIIGGGAAGFFTAINIKEKNPSLSVAILEKSEKVLSKVRISGGGRCNVTNNCPDVQLLLKHYPRGEKELRGPFQRFGNKETVQWFEQRGVPLKAQDDGRFFPVSNQSESIIQCFLDKALQLNIPIFTGQSVMDFHKNEAHLWEITTTQNTLVAKNLVITTGSNTKIWNLLEKLGHTIITPTPSLFSFNISDPKLHEMMGIALPVEVKIKDHPLQSEGNMLITHWGLSGPAILKLSAWGSKILAEKQYHFNLEVNWIPKLPYEEVLKDLNQNRIRFPKRSILKNPHFGFTHRLWEYLVTKAGIQEKVNYAEISKTNLQNLARQLHQTTYEVNGKSTFKDEFVTAGGVDLKEVNFKTMESKHFPGLYFAGEVLDIDAITGGFNFQNAWTGGWIISEAFKP